MGDIEWAAEVGVGVLDDVEIDHGGGDFGVAEEGLDRAEVGSGFEEVCGEGVAEAVGSDSFFDACFTEGALKGVGVGAGVEVVAAEDARFGIG